MDTEELFNFYLEKIDNSQAMGNTKKASKYIACAIKIPDLNDKQLWMLDYYKTMIALDKKNFNFDDVCRALLNLIERAQLFSENDMYCVFEPYVDVLYNLLLMHIGLFEELSQYEAVASELYTYVVEYDMKEIIDEDLYSFVNLILGVINNFKGRSLMAEEYLQKIQEQIDDETVLSEYGFLGLLILAETKETLGKFDEAANIYFELLEFILDGRIFYDINKVYIQAVIKGIVAIGAMVNQPEMIVEIIEIFMFKSNIFKHASNDLSWVLYSQYLGAMYTLKRKIKPKVLRKIKRVMSNVKQEQMFLDTSNNLLYSYYNGCYLLAKMCGDKDAVLWLDEGMKVALNENTPEREKICYLSAVRSAICLYREEKLEDRAFECAENIMKKLILFYSLAEFDTDNERLEQYFSVCNDSFMMAYAVLENVKSIKQRLEYRMNYKNILSSVIRERNKCDNPIYREKRQDEFLYYNFDDLNKILPENTGVIDFYYNNEAIAHEVIERRSYYEDASLEVILVKKEKMLKIFSCKIPDTHILNEKISVLQHVLQSQSGKYKKNAKDILNILFGDFLEELAGLNKIWISPDFILNNMPFDLLFEAADDENSLEEIVYIPSIRNLFETETLEENTDKACVIGNPAYETNDILQQNKDDISRNSQEYELSRLPYSEYEAFKISEIIESDCFVEKNATKYVITPGYRYIHIATHGIVPEKYDNPWYESTLAFSGITNFKKSGKISKRYGNGTLSSEEISRMKLEGTQLVVLSACNSGISLLSKFQQQSGLHIAFGAAGVTYVISALWQVNDLATVFFMMFLYKGMSECNSVPKALKKAKERMKSAKVSDILEIVEKDILKYSVVTEDVLRWLKSLPLELQLYSSPYYWAGFVCYQYRRNLL